MSLTEFYFKNIISPSDRYLRIHTDLGMYFNNMNLAAYFTFLAAMSKQHSTEEEQNPWFYIPKPYISKYLPPRLTNSTARRNMDKKLLHANLIKTKFTKEQIPRRKLYRLNFEGCEVIVQKILKGETRSCQLRKNGGTRRATSAAENILNSKKLNKSFTSVNDYASGKTRRERIQAGYMTLQEINEAAKEVKLKRRRYKTLEHEIINFWNRKEHNTFFAKVIKRQPVIDILLPMISGNKSLTEKQYADKALQITQAITKCFTFHVNPAFLFATNRKLSLKQFLTPITRHSPKAFDILHRSVHLRNKQKSWLNAFMYSPDSWLDNKLLRKVKVNTTKYFNAKMIQILNLKTDEMTHRDMGLLKRATQLAQQYQDVNDFSVLENLEEFVKNNGNRPQLYWYASKAFWNNTFTNFIVNNNISEGVANI